MRTNLLILVSLLLPLVWGWGVYRLLAWLWPAPNDGRSTSRHTDGPDPVIDYQI
jgi:hypothetical protein